MAGARVWLVGVALALAACGGEASAPADPEPVVAVDADFPPGTYTYTADGFETRTVVSYVDAGEWVQEDHQGNGDVPVTIVHDGRMCSVFQDADTIFCRPIDDDGQMSPGAHYLNLGFLRTLARDELPDDLTVETRGQIGGGGTVPVPIELTVDVDAWACPETWRLLEYRPAPLIDPGERLTELAEEGYEIVNSEDLDRGPQGPRSSRRCRSPSSPKRSSRRPLAARSLVVIRRGPVRSVNRQPAGRIRAARSR